MPHARNGTRVRVDQKGRISLPKNLCAGVSSFLISQDTDGRLVLEPFAEIPARELWVHANPIAKEQIQRGLAQSAAGETLDRGSFAQYADDGDDV